MAETGEVQLHFLDYWRVVKNRWGIITLTFLLVVVTAYVTTYFLPKKFTSFVNIEVKPNMRIISMRGGENLSGIVDPHFVADQVAILRSKGILYPVIDELGLVDKWSQGLPQGQKYSKDDVYGQISRNMMDGIQEQRGTDILYVPVTSTDKQEAKDIANTIAVIYQKQRRDDLEQQITTALQELNSEVEKQRVKVEQAQALVDKIRDRDKIDDPNPESMESNDMEAQRKLLAEEPKLRESEQKVQEMKTLLSKIDKMSPQELMSALAPLGIQDATVPELLPKYQAASSDEANLKAGGLGSEHPRIKSLEAEMAVWKTQLDSAVDSVKTTLKTKQEMAQNELDSEQKIYNEVKAQALKNTTFSEEYVKAKEDYINAKKLLVAAQQEYETESMEMHIEMSPAKIWDKAEIAYAPSSPNTKAYLWISVVVGLGLGVGLAFFLEYLDTSVKTLADVEKFIGVSVLAVVPKIGGLLHKAEGGRSPDAETYRTLRTNIDFHKPSPDANTLTVISGGPGEGKSTTLCNLAVICANAGSNVLIVDADLRRPSQHKFFDMDGTVGLVNYVNGEKEFDDVIFQTSVENLWLIPSGSLTKDPVAILNSHRVVELITRAKTQFDMVLFDSPPILGLSDGAVLSSVAEMTVMVVQHRRFPRASLLRVKQAVLNVGGNLTGVVLNRVDTRDDQNYYYYTSYYDYYAPIPSESTPQHKADI